MHDTHVHCERTRDERRAEDQKTEARLVFRITIILMINALSALLPDSYQLLIESR